MYFIIVSDCFFLLLGSSSGGVRAVVFERLGSSGGVFNAVYAAFRRSVSRRFERGRFERGSSSGGNCGDSKSYGQDLILNTPNGGTYGFTYLIR